MSLEKRVVHRCLVPCLSLSLTSLLSRPVFIQASLSSCVWFGSRLPRTFDGRNLYPPGRSSCRSDMHIWARRCPRWCDTRMTLSWRRWTLATRDPLFATWTSRRSRSGRRFDVVGRTRACFSRRRCSGSISTTGSCSLTLMMSGSTWRAVCWCRHWRRYA